MTKFALFVRHHEVLDEGTSDSYDDIYENVHHDEYDKEGSYDIGYTTLMMLRIMINPYSGIGAVREE